MFGPEEIKSALRAAQSISKQATKLNRFETEVEPHIAEGVAHFKLSDDQGRVFLVSVSRYS